MGEEEEAMIDAMAPRDAFGDLERKEDEEYLFFVIFTLLTSIWTLSTQISCVRQKIKQIETVARRGRRSREVASTQAFHFLGR